MEMYRYKYLPSYQLYSVLNICSLTTLVLLSFVSAYMGMV